MSARCIGFTACALLGFASGSVGQTAPPESTREASADQSAWTVVVIKLRYADAEEVARVLRELLPSTVRVVPYHPTNSVLLAGDRAIIGELEKGIVEEEQ
jgi:hypothetical protein